MGDGLTKRTFAVARSVLPGKSNATGKRLATSARQEGESVYTRLGQREARLKFNPYLKDRITQLETLITDLQRWIPINTAPQSTMPTVGSNVVSAAGPIDELPPSEILDRPHAVCLYELGAVSLFGGKLYGEHVENPVPLIKCAMCALAATYLADSIPGIGLGRQLAGHVKRALEPVFLETMEPTVDVCVAGMFLVYFYLSQGTDSDAKAGMQLTRRLAGFLKQLWSVGQIA